MTDVGLLQCDPSAVIASTAVVGARPRTLQEGVWEHENPVTVLARGVEIGHFCTIEEGVRIGPDTIVGSQVTIQAGAVVGGQVLLNDRAFVGARSQVADGAVIGGSVADRSVVGAGARVMGTLLHAHRDPSLPWDAPDSEEPSPRVGAGGFVGFDAKVIGPVVVGSRAYVCAGAILTRDVPSEHIAYGVNQVVHRSEWRGPLGRSNFFSAPVER